MKGKIIKMKLLGIVRRIDELGRIVVPMELRRILEINEKDQVEIFAENDRIIIKKFTPTCLFCGSNNNIVDFKSKLICEECLEILKKTGTVQ